jgi:NodT family efflux transporter outer membrane factor (OMF) lipoprotein
LGALAAAALLAACSSLAPKTERPAAPVPAQLPLPVELAASAPAAPVEPLTWQQFVREPALRQLIETALANNRDLRVATLTVERARAQLDIARADKLPTVGVGVTANSAPNVSTGNQAQTYTAGLQLASWEIDFLGRIGNLNDAARAQLLATEAGRRSAELALVGAVASSYLNLVGDAQLLGVAERTLVARESTLRLTRTKADAGAASAIELQSAVSLVAQARVARQQALRQRQQDLATLALLLGQPVPEALVPAVPSPGDGSAPSAPAADGEADAQLAALLADVPVGLGSEVLLRRPDVVQAERQLEAADANIGAARAAMWPRVTLTASAGQASSQLSGLFQGGNFAWTLGAQALFTLFDSGRNQANVNAATVGRDIAVAQYERAVQAAFKDTADALGGLSTWRAQREAQAEQLASARELARLTELRYRAGAASELERLDAQRNLYAAEQGLIQTRLAEQQNRVALWKALGG